MYRKGSKNTRYSCYINKWCKTMSCPEWYSDDTRGCPHPHGVILAGSSKKGYGKKVAFMDIHNKKTIKLPDLKYNLRNAGMVFDVDTGKLIIAGGETYIHDDTGVRDFTLTKVVFRLSELTNSAVWEELEVLSDPVANPMLVNDNDYLYVLGGVSRATCVRMLKERKDNWEVLDDLPKEADLPAGASLVEEYNGNLYSGALVYDKKVKVFTRTRCLTLEGNPQTWTSQPYAIDPEKPELPDSTIKHLTLALHNDWIVAGIERKQQGITVEKCNTSDGKKYWQELVPAPKKGEIGAGRFLSIFVVECQ